MGWYQVALPRERTKAGRGLAAVGGVILGAGCLLGVTAHAQTEGNLRAVSQPFSPQVSTSVAAYAAPDATEAVSGTEGVAASAEDQRPRDADMPGRHELGAWAGFSLHSGHYLGYAKNVKWFPLNVRYSYRFWTHDTFALRYAPEMTALVLLDEASFYSADPSSRRRTLGGGLSPAGFEMDFYPKKRIQPFINEHSGLDYFAQRVLSTEGSQLLFQTDLGLGLNFFTKGKRQNLTIAYRYQHLSNANISNRNPGTDTNTFYFGYSRFWTKGVR